MKEFDKIGYLGREHFVHFSNTDEFKEDLSLELRNFLTNTGIMSHPFRYPNLVSKGILSRYGDTLIKLGENRGGFFAYVINTEDNNSLYILDMENPDEGIFYVNESVQMYVEFLYELEYHNKEFVLKDVFGDYYKNYEKYANRLQEVFNALDPKAVEGHIWGGLLEQMEMGVL